MALLIGCFRFSKLDFYNPQCSERWMNEEKRWFRDHTLKPAICILACLIKYSRYLLFLFVICILYLFCSHLVSAGVPFLITAELFKQSHRPAAYIVGGSLNWLSNFTVGFVFPFLQVKALRRVDLSDLSYVTRLIWFNSLYLLYFMCSNYPSYTSICLPSEVSGVLRLPGVCRYLSVRGRLRLCGDSRDQKQDLYGDQPDVLEEGAHPGDAGPDERGPAAAEEDERLRWGWSHFAGVWQLFICSITQMVLMGSHSGKSEKFKS